MTGKMQWIWLVVALMITPATSWGQETVQGAEEAPEAPVAETTGVMEEKMETSTVLPTTPEKERRCVDNKTWEEHLAQAKQYFAKKLWDLALDEALIARDKCDGASQSFDLHELIGRVYYELNQIGPAMEADERALKAEASEEDKTLVRESLALLKRDYVRVTVVPSLTESDAELRCPGTIAVKKKVIMAAVVSQAQIGQIFDAYLPNQPIGEECKIGAALVSVAEGHAVPILYKIPSPPIHLAGSVFFYPAFAGGEYPGGVSGGSRFYRRDVSPLGFNMEFKLGAELGYFRTFADLNRLEYNRDSIGQLELLLRAELSRGKIYALGAIGPGLITEGGLGFGASAIIAAGFKFNKMFSAEWQLRGTFGSVGFLWMPLCVRMEL